jgi:hypothetical protein
LNFKHGFYWVLKRIPEQGNEQHPLIVSQDDPPQLWSNGIRHQYWDKVAVPSRRARLNPQHIHISLLKLMLIRQNLPELDKAFDQLKE